MLGSTPEYLAAHHSNLHASAPRAGLAQLMAERRAQRWNSLASFPLRIFETTRGLLTRPLDLERSLANEGPPGDGRP
jgi:hypothetical protein